MRGLLCDEMGVETQDTLHLDTTQPKGKVVETIGIEPTTPCLQSRCSPS